MNKHSFMSLCQCMFSGKDYSVTLCCKSCEEAKKAYNDLVESITNLEERGESLR